MTWWMTDLGRYLTLSNLKRNPGAWAGPPPVRVPAVVARWLSWQGVAPRPGTNMVGFPAEPLGSDQQNWDSTFQTFM